jgi:hypothetical protein
MFPATSGRPAVRTIVLAATVAMVAALAIGCRSRPSAQDSPSSAPSAIPASARIGVVDVQAVAKAHPRWAELDGLNTRVAQAETALALVPPPPLPPQTDVSRALDEEARRLKASFEEEVNALREDRRVALETYAADVKKSQEAKFAVVRAQMEDEARKAIDAYREELRAQLRAAETEIMAEYRYPLLNLRLRAEVAGLRSEEEGRQVLRQLQALQQEREERIRTEGEEIERKFQEFQKAKEAEVNAALKAQQDALTAEGQRMVESKKQEFEAEMAREASSKQRQFTELLERRRKELIAAAEAQLRGRQTAYLRELDQRTAQLRAQLVSLQEQRARLEDAILAEVKIEVATIAQAQQMDVVLTRHVSSRGLIDLTADVIRKIRR